MSEVVSLTLTLAYIVLTVYTVWVTLINVVLIFAVRAIKGLRASIRTGAALGYIILWTLVIFLPILKAAILD